MNHERLPMTIGETISFIAIMYMIVFYGIALRCYLEGATSAGRIKYTQGLFRQVFKCFYEDLMLHCPWSRSISICHRMRYLVQLAYDRPDWKFENPKGVWTCAELQKADEAALRIAAEGCFNSRTRFWFDHLLSPLLMPMVLIIIIVLIVILIPFGCVAYLFGWRPNSKSSE